LMNVQIREPRSTHVDVDSLCVNKDACNVLRDGLLYNSTLTSLHLTNSFVCDCTYTFWKVMVEVLNVNTTMEVVKLPLKGIKSPDCKTALDRMKENVKQKALRNILSKIFLKIQNPGKLRDCTFAFQ
jgi:hypothetical protein